MACSHKLPTPLRTRDGRSKHASCRLRCRIMLLPMLDQPNPLLLPAQTSIQATEKDEKLHEEIRSPEDESQYYADTLNKIIRRRQLRILGNSFRIHVQDICFVESLSVGCCMADIESVLDDFSSRGEFAFGSFWGSELESSRRFQPYLDEEEAGYDVLFDRIAWRC